jgi:3-oxocholest-4-en-26-oyl-CoA dehydrogenase beta subunit
VNFDLSDEQQVVRDLATQLFSNLAPTERVKAVERSTDPHERGFDRELWAQLAESGILSLCLPEDDGGSGMGTVEMALVLEQQGRYVAPVPLWPTLTAAMTIAEFGTAEQRARHLPAVVSGDRVLSVALSEPGANDVLKPTLRAVAENGALRIRGTKPAVPYGQHADIVVVPVVDDSGSIALVMIDAAADGVVRIAVDTTAHEPQAHLDLDVLVPLTDVLGHDGTNNPVHGGEALRWVYEHSLISLCAIQLGVAQGSLAIMAEHVSNRQQFGKPLSTFQAVTQRAADGYITTEAMRVTTLNAAWRLAEGYDARRDVEVATFWAADGGQQVITAGQHLHGGIGSDIDYPVHRYFIWGTQLATVLGGASAHLARLGRLIAST